MNIVHSWLSDFLSPIPSPEEIARILAGMGLEIASIRKRAIPTGVVVARVDAVTKHPNADKLSVCSVNAGGSAALTVVCGAPNVAAGMTVALATPGTALGSGMVIKKAAIRGVSSDGMLCSERELGISDDHSGIMSLPPSLVPGTALRDSIPDDAVLELEITPNRGDCLSMLGVAREVAAKLRRPIADTVKRPQESAAPIGDSVSVTIEAPHLCPRYTGRLVRNVKIGPSPEWLKNRLASAGLRSINNVVDVTNYILLHFGHPMHAFDYARIAGHTIFVRNATAGQKFVTLDEVERTLSADDLLIYDGEKAVALAGVMGGRNSGIDDTTTDVFLECAYFDPATIRKTSKRLGLSTDSSYRFERGVDPGEGLINALDTAAELIRELAGGSIASGRIDVMPTAIKPRMITLRTAQVARLLGITMTDDDVVSHLQSLGIRALSRENGQATFQAPAHRHDLALEADLIEEVGRLYGYDNIPPASHATVSLHQPSPVWEKRCDTSRLALAGRGLHEIYTNSMIAPKRTAQLTPDMKPVALANPLTPDMSHMRTTLLANMLDIIAYNLNRKNANHGYFELGKTYESVEGSPLPRERDVLSIGLEGDALPAAWNTSAVKNSLHTLKAVIESWAAVAGIHDLAFATIDGPHAYFGQERASVRSAQGVTGVLGAVAGEVLRTFEVKSTVCYAEIDITEFLSRGMAWPSYRSIPKFPPAVRDFCFVMPEELLSGNVEKEIATVSPLVEAVQAFDVYRGEHLGAGRKSIAYSVSLRSPERTLTDKETEQAAAAIVRRMKEKFGIDLRK